MTAYIQLYVSDFEGDDDDGHPTYMSGKSLRAEKRGLTLLSSVCYDWYQSMVGWPQSPTPQWMRHQLEKLIKRKLRLYL